jgi:hypothetical protein
MRRSRQRVQIVRGGRRARSSQRESSHDRLTRLEQRYLTEAKLQIALDRLFNDALAQCDGPVTVRIVNKPEYAFA